MLQLIAHWHCSQAEKRNADLEDKVHTLQAQLSIQDAEVAELKVKSQAVHAASRPPGSQAGQEEDRKSLKAMQATTRNVLLAQVCSARVSGYSMT